MPPRRRPYQAKRPIESYDHRDKDRLNNPPVGLVTPETDLDVGRKTYAYDPHLDPQLQWAGKAEHTSFEVPTVSLHVHERIDPRTIIEATRKRNGSGDPVQGSLFELPEENPPVRSAIEFYQHRHNWTNRLVAGDSLLVMNSLLEKEGMAGKVQMVYIDPPYGIRYGSNFQPFVNRRDVRDGRDEDLTQEPETIKAFRDTWELGIHSYLSYLRDRLLLARELLTESGSCFVQISDENLHRVRLIMDEVFGEGNFVVAIKFSKTAGLGGKFLDETFDYLLWYAKSRDPVKFRRPYLMRVVGAAGARQYRFLMGDSGAFAEVDASSRTLDYSRLFSHDNFTSQTASDTTVFPFSLNGITIAPPRNGGWKSNSKGVERLKKAERVIRIGATARFVRYFSDAPYFPVGSAWLDTAISGFGESKVYVVQTLSKVIQRCILMTTDPGDLVFDPTCGSGTTSYVAEQWGRRWITCDTSRVAVSLAKQRLMTALFDYYELAHPDEGVGSGFNYKTVPHITLRDIAQNSEIDTIWEKHQQELEPLRSQLNTAIGKTWEEWEIPREAEDAWPSEAQEAHAVWWKRRIAGQKEIDDSIARNSRQETLYDQPLVDRDKRRVTGPFSVEAVPAPAVKPIDDVDAAEPLPADDTVARSGETLRQADWRDELLKTGI